MAARRLRPGPGRDGCRGPAILDTAAPLYNPHYLNELGSPRFPDLRKFTGMLNGKRRNALSVPVGGGGSLTYTQNAHRKQRPVTWRRQGQAQSPTCSIRRSTCRSSSVQNRCPTSPDDSRQRCCGATSKCWNPLAYPAIQFRHITGPAIFVLRFWPVI